jgi:hypothetical protein
MKSLSNNVMMFALAIVLGISPIQSIVASVSDCYEIKQDVSHSMKISGSAMQHHQVNSNNQHGCCETTSCDMTHCASFVAIAITADTQNEMFYAMSDVVATPTEKLLPFYPPSLYRPPKA